MAWLADNPPEVGPLFFGGGSNILPIPVFTLQPQSQTVDEYAMATFTAAADNATSYQWSKNAAGVGTDSASYSLTTTTADNGAVVNVTATGDGGSTVSNNATLSVTSYAYQLDSLTSKFVLSSPITVAIGDKITVNVICSPNTITGSSYSRFIGSEDFTITVDTGVDGNKFRLLGCTAKLGGVSIASDVTPIPTDLVARDLEVTLTKSGTIAAIAGLKDTSGRSINAKMRYLSFTRAAGNRFIPLNKVSQGGAQLPTVGTISASILNYNPAGWMSV